MEVALPQNSPRKYMAYAALTALAIAMVIWTTLLLLVAPAHDTPNVNHTYPVSFGPLTLSTLTIATAAGGLKTMTIAFEAGFAWYVLLWLACGLVAGYALHKFRHPSTGAAGTSYDQDPTS